MNTYKAFFGDRTIILDAPTSYEAQVKASREFKTRFSYQVEVKLIAKDGVEVAHSTASIG